MRSKEGFKREREKRRIGRGWKKPGEKKKGTREERALRKGEKMFLGRRNRNQA